MLMTLPPSVDSDYFYYLLMMSMTNTSFCLAIIEKKEIPEDHGSMRPLNKAMRNS